MAVCVVGTLFAALQQPRAAWEAVARAGWRYIAFGSLMVCFATNYAFGLMLCNASVAVCSLDAMNSLWMRQPDAIDAAAFQLEVGKHESAAQRPSHGRPHELLPRPGRRFRRPRPQVMLFYLNPFWAAILDTVVLGRSLPTHTLQAMPCALFAVAIPTALDTFFGDTGADAGGKGPFWMLVGFACALLGGVGYAGFLTTCQAAAKADPNIPMNLGAVVGNGTAGVCGMLSLLSRGVDVGALMPGGYFWLLLATDAGCVAAAMALLCMAGSRLPSSDLALILLSEVAAGAPRRIGGRGPALA